MAKKFAECFLCEHAVKCKRFTFYSGVKKGGTTHRMLSCTIEFFERWSDLIIHEIGVCRDCQVRLWRKKQYWPMVLAAIGAGCLFLTTLLLLLVFDATNWLVLLPAGLLGLLALGLGGLFAYYLMLYQTREFVKGQLDQLVIAEAMDKLPQDDHTFLTTEQYLERHQKGIIG